MPELSESEAKEMKGEVGLPLNKKSQIPYITREPEASLKHYMREM
jgi:hypothetical protein